MYSNSYRLWEACCNTANLGRLHIFLRKSAQKKKKEEEENAALHGVDLP